ncbi:hypothetical protein OTK59_14415 [Vibrio natriegens]|uniref:hypothetical protein n=1 Tax=Vibrio natriegens TaxID=691 RepID=UPI002284CF11|nr:hypothetical protein [Vibrio natriegens]MCY9877747.1 hypothetical protein [Vibrio natriegens]
MEKLKEKFNTALTHFEKDYQRAKFLELVGSIAPNFKAHLDCAANELGVEILQEPIVLPLGTSLAKAKMRINFYINSANLKQPLKIDLALTSYLYKQEDQRASYLKDCITRHVDKKLNVKIKQEKPLHVRFEEMLTTYKKGFQITQVHLETLGKVNKIIRNHSLKLFGNTITEPTIYDYCYGSKVTFNEIINIIKEVE